MKALPVADPGVPDARTAKRYLWWLARTQAGTLLGGMLFGILWMVSQALIPAAIGTGVDALTRADGTGLLRASGLVAALGAGTVLGGIMRHRFAVANFLAAGARTIQVTTRHVTRLGGTLAKHLSTGEVVSIGTSDVETLGDALDVTARGSGAVAAVVVVTVIMLRVSVPLGLVVLIGVPALLALAGLLLRPLHGRREAQRELVGDLTNRVGDIVAGLRVLRGVGGEDAFGARYRAQSQRVRTAGVHVAAVESWLEAAQVLLPGSFLALVTWLAARFALAGRITPGELVAFYGYAAFLVLPLRTVVEMADRITRGLVAAGRVARLLRLEPEIVGGDRPVGGGELVEPESGVVIKSGVLTAVAASGPDEATAVADRLTYFDAGSRATLGGVPVCELRLADLRRHVLLADNDGRLFRGPMRDWVGIDAVRAAAAEDIVDALPDGLDTELAERGRQFSGGQQQRLRLARALTLDPPILVLVEPTSAVDAHTEARIAERLGPARAGRTTVVCTTSPLLLGRADRVLFVHDGRVVAEGRHRELLGSCPAYRSTVTRGELS